MPAQLFRWNGEALVPFNDACWRWVRENLRNGGRYNATVEGAERSHASHAHYFAMIKDMWDSLPDRLVMDFPTPEHLRKRALIETGWVKMADAAFTSGVDANTAARIIRKHSDDYAVVIVRGTVVRTYEALSQSVKAMGKKDFQTSKDDVLGWIEGLLEGERHDAPK